MIRFKHIIWASLRYGIYALPFVLIAVFFLVRRFFWQRNTAIFLGFNAPGMRLLKHFSLVRKGLKVLLLSAALIFLAAALARPQWGNSSETVSQEGRDVLIALDISRSMLAQDVYPSRIEFAKKKIRDFVDRVTAERLSLMVFSGVPFIQCPFTADVHAFLNFLSLADVETVSSGTTALDKVLEKALETFSTQPLRKNRLMIIITDGEDFSHNLEGVKARAQELGLTIFTLGVGTIDGAPIPLMEGGSQQGHIKDAQGSIVISRLNEPLLSDLSAKTGAEYIRATEDDSDIRQLLSDLQHFEKEKGDERTFSTKKEKYMYFALVSFLCLILEWVL